MPRKIIHIDMDAFYASVEQLDNPYLRGKPIVVGGEASRGVVAAASYEARKFGVRSAMSGKLARELCEELIFVNPRFDRYKELSEKIRTVFYSHTDLVEPLSLDEAYLDVTENKRGFSSATQLARQIRKEIYELTGLNASAGISTNKFLAKIASDINKPNGQKTIPPEEVQHFIDTLPIEKFYGVGKVTRLKMYELGIFYGRDLKAKSIEFLEKHFKNNAVYYANLSRGIHTGAVRSQRLRKSVGVEKTFEKNIPSELLLLSHLKKLAFEASYRLQKNKLKGKTITLKIKFSDFSVETRSKTISEFTADPGHIFKNCSTLLHSKKNKDSVRLVGVSISNLDNQPTENSIKQLTINF